MIAVIALALLGSALAVPQFAQQPPQQFAQQTQTRTFATTRTQQPAFQQQFAPAPVAQQPQQFAQQPKQFAQQPQQFAQQPKQFAQQPQQFAQQPKQAPITVLQRTELSDENGNSQTSVTQSDGSSFSDTIRLEPTNDNLDKVVVKTGSYSYVSPEGVPVMIEYTADRYGYHPKGSPIPI